MPPWSDQLIAGFARPFALVGALRQHPERWRRWKRTVALQALLTLVLGSAWVALDVVLDEAPEEGESPVAFWWALWLSNVVAVQWVVLALGRTFQDRLAHDLAVGSGLHPEEDDVAPRLSFDVKWVWKRLRRKLRAAWLTLGTALVFSPQLLALWVVPGVGEWLARGAFFFITAGWWVVFTAALSGWSWRGEDDLTAPRWLQRANAVVSRHAGLRWLGLHWSLSALHRVMRPLVAPARAVEEDWPTWLGLSLARVVASVPVVRLGLRAAMVVAAGEALLCTRPLEAPDPPHEPTRDA